MIKIGSQQFTFQIDIVEYEWRIFFSKYALQLL